MSYDISLMYNDEIAIVDEHIEGAVYVLGGSEEAHLNVTYNYAKFYYDNLDEELGIRWLYGKTASETIAKLKIAINILGVDRDNDYWKPTPGNAGYALSVLLGWAKQHPNAVFEGD